MAAGAEPLVVWINGAFGVGKSAVAEELAPLLANAVVFDPEPFGAVLRDVVPADEQTDDFQDIPAWRAAVRAAVGSLALSRRGPVVVPMTLAEPAYHDEIVGGIRAAGVGIAHVTLAAPAEIVRARLRSRSRDETWGMARAERCVEALAGARFAQHVDASCATPSELAARLADVVHSSFPGHRA